MSASPLFPLVPRPTYTLLDSKAKAEGYADDLQQTVFGETYNASEVSTDSLRIFVPDCADQGDGSFRFLRVLPGEPFEDFGDTPEGAVEVAALGGINPTLERLLRSRFQFQFVAAPGTEREQRYRVSSSGKLQKIDAGTAWVPFRLRLTLPDTVYGYPQLLVRSQGNTTVRWKETGPTSEVKYADLRRKTLMDLADVFYALNALDDEAIGLYGRIVGLCALCGRQLDDAISLSRGVGPSCLKKLIRKAAPDLLSDQEAGE